MPIEPGSLDRQIVVQQQTEAQGDSGFPVTTWSALVTVWASKRDMKGSERFTAGQTTSPFDTLWTMHYRADCDPDLVDVVKARRITYQGRAYNIVFGRHIDLKAGIELMTLGKGAVEL